MLKKKQRAKGRGQEGFDRGQKGSSQTPEWSQPVGLGSGVSCAQAPGQLSKLMEGWGWQRETLSGPASCTGL